MRSDGLSFHRPLAFWLGCALLVAGVLAHLPMFLMAAPMHYRLAGMPMDSTMLVGMAHDSARAWGWPAYGLMPDRARSRARYPAGLSAGSMASIWPTACRSTARTRRWCWC